MTELRAQYDWLLFFSIPKILNLYKLLISSDLNIQLDFIIHEISFLCKNDVRTREDLKHRVQVILHLDQMSIFAQSFNKHFEQSH